MSVRKSPALLFAAALLAAACGGSSDDTTAGASADSSAATSVAESSDGGSSAATTDAPDGDADMVATTVSPTVPSDVSNGGFDSANILDGNFVTVDGADFDLSTLRNKDLVVWFWAPW